MAAYHKVEVSLNTNAVEVGIPSPQTVNVVVPTIGPAGPTGSVGPVGPQGPQGVPGTGLEVLTTQGDILYQGASTGQRLAIGTSGQVLKVANGIPAWGAESGAVSSVAGRTGAVVLAVADVADAVATSDARLSDARTPSSTLAHAESHAAGGSDPVILSQLDSQPSGGVNKFKLGLGGDSPTGRFVGVSTAGDPIIGVLSYGSAEQYDPSAEVSSSAFGMTFGATNSSMFAQYLKDGGLEAQYDFPAAGGTVALTDDIPTEVTDLAATGISADYVPVAQGDGTIVWEAQSGGGGGDTVSIETTAADILSVSSGAISADDAGADRIVYWNNTSNKLTYGTPSDVGAAASSHTHSDATQSVAGFLSTADKTKLDGIASGAEVNVNADWNASSGDAQILNKPTLGTAAAAATTDFAAASHTHPASAISDSTTAGRALLTGADAAAQRTTLGLGTLATQNGTFSGTSSGTNTGDQTITLTGDVTGSGTGSFAATIANDAVTYAKLQNVSATSRILGRKTAAAGDTEECTLSEILDFVGSAAQGDILYRGASTWTRLAAGTNGHYLQTKGSGANPEWAAVSGGSGGTKTYAVFTAEHNQPPATDFATLDTRNSVAVLDFSDTATENAVFVGIMPEAASLGSGLIVRLHWMGTATTGNVRWSVAFERGNTDLDADSFDTATAATATTNGTSGIVTVTAITCTSIDSIAAGDLFRLRVQRLGADAADTMTGAKGCELVAVEIRSAA
jgi:hypothetical protein